MYEKGSFVAIFKEEEPFWIAECSQCIPESSEKTYKIRWLERSGLEGNMGTLYSLGPQDKIFTSNIICTVKIIRRNRFHFLLSLEEEKQILNRVKNEECEDNTDAPNVNYHIKTYDDLQKREIHELQLESGRENVSNNEFEKYDEVNVCDIKDFSETKSLVTADVPNISENGKRLILEEIVNSGYAKKDLITKQSKQDVTEFQPLMHSANECNTTNTPKINIISQHIIMPSTSTSKMDCTSSDSEDEPFQSSGSEYTPSVVPPSYSSSEEDDELTKSLKRSFEQATNLTTGMSSDNERPTKLTTNMSSQMTSTNAFEQSNILATPMSSPISESFAKIPEFQNLEENDSDSEITRREAWIKFSSKTVTGNRVYDKRHACYFCDKLIGKVTRHLELVHKEEMEVAKLLAMDNNSNERKEEFLCLLRAGDYYHNSRVLATHTGELILSRRPSQHSTFQDLKDYGPCPNCLGFFLLHTLWRHVKYNCPNKKKFSSNCKNRRRDVIGESYALLSSWSETYTSVEFKKCILALFKMDNISSICKEDQLIIKLGSLLFEKFTVQQHDYIRQTMRQLGRLLLQVKSVNPSITNLNELLQPKNFDTLIESVKKLCISTITDQKSQNYQTPSLALKLGHSLKKCAQIARGIALRKGDLKTDREMKGFLEIMNIEWNNRISSTALKTLYNRKMNSTQLLPVTEDILKLNKILDNTISELSNSLHLNILQNWGKLAAATLSRIILFNKRRSGEASRMTLNQYACRPSWDEQCTSELKQSLTPLEVTLANRLTVVEVPGKSRKNFKVPILLTKDLKIAIDKLVENRSLVNINVKNNYVFARGSMSLGHMRGHDCLKQFTTGANLQQPQLITSTKLRKYIATVVQIFDLKENETDWLARHLGHDVRIHRDFYRLHESAVELTKVSRLLLAVDQGSANNFVGKSLADIQVEDLPNIDDSEKSGSDSDDDLNKECTVSNVEEFKKLHAEREKKSKQQHYLSKIEDSEKGGNSSEDEDTTNNGREVTALQAHFKSTKIARKNRKQKNEKSTTKKATSTKRPWSSEEKDSVLKFFSKHIKIGKVPSKVESDECKNKYKNVLHSRTWRDIKYCVHNHIRSLERKK